MSNEVYLDNGPLQGKSITLRDFQSINFSDGFYMRNDKKAATTSKQKVSSFTWIAAASREITLLIGESGEGEGVTVDSAWLDLQGHMHLRLRKHAIEQDLYQFWKDTVKLRTRVSVIFQDQRYEGRADLVGRNDGEDYMFLHFDGRQAAALQPV